MTGVDDMYSQETTRFNINKPSQVYLARIKSYGLSVLRLCFRRCVFAGKGQDATAESRSVVLRLYARRGRQ